MVRIPSLSRHSAPEPPPSRDEDRDGRADTPDGNPAARMDTRDKDRAGRMDTRGERTTGTTQNADTEPTRAGAGREPVDRDGAGAPPKHQARSAVVERGTDTRPAPPAIPDTGRRTEPEHRPEAERRLGEPGLGDRGTAERTQTAEPDIVEPAGPRPRASTLATLSLIIGVAAAGFVLTGTLAGYGIGLGGLAVLLAIGGVSATARRHVAGRSDALLGLALGLGAVIVGVLAMTGQFAWPTTDGDTVVRFREWLDSQFVDRF